MQDRIGVRVPVGVVDPDGVERSVGTMRRIVGQRVPGWPHGPSARPITAIDACWYT